jgi:hypothetical protein
MEMEKLVMIHCETAIPLSARSIRLPPDERVGGLLLGRHHWSWRRRLYPVNIFTSWSGLKGVSSLSAEDLAVHCHLAACFPIQRALVRQMLAEGMASLVGLDQAPP